MIKIESIPARMKVLAESYNPIAPSLNTAREFKRAYAGIGIDTEESPLAWGRTAIDTLPTSLWFVTPKTQSALSIDPNLVRDRGQQLGILKEAYAAAFSDREDLEEDPKKKQGSYTNELITVHEYMSAITGLSLPISEQLSLLTTARMATVGNLLQTAACPEYPEAVLVAQGYVRSALEYTDLEREVRRVTGTFNPETVGMRKLVYATDKQLFLFDMYVNLLRNAHLEDGNGITADELNRFGYYQAAQATTEEYLDIAQRRSAKLIEEFASQALPQETADPASA